MPEKEIKLKVAEAIQGDFCKNAQKRSFWHTRKAKLFSVSRKKHLSEAFCFAKASRIR